MTEARAAAARRPTEAAVRPDRPRQHNVDYPQPQRDAQRRIDTLCRAKPFIWGGDLRRR
ncbi:MAG TPA: hypothetical protein VGP04_06375 [Pseudonocardiaceae bacterium]|nr:hypothetical protein [Pseudonocardiaceae bacterium]